MTHHCSPLDEFGIPLTLPETPFDQWCEDCRRFAIGERVAIRYRALGFWVGTVTTATAQGVPTLIDDEVYGPVAIHLPVVLRIDRREQEPA